MARNLEIKNVRETATLAKAFALELLRTKLGRTASVVGLVGELGAGKTLFVKSFMRTIGVRQKLISPTFILMRSFPLKGPRYHRAYHIDAYRTNGLGLKKLGVADVIKNPKNIVLIEWADRARSILPRGAVIIDFKHGKRQNERHLTFNRR